MVAVAALESQLLFVIALQADSSISLPRQMVSYILNSTTSLTTQAISAAVRCWADIASISEEDTQATPASKDVTTSVTPTEHPTLIRKSTKTSSC